MLMEKKDKFFDAAKPKIWVELGRRDVEHLGVSLPKEFHVQADPRAVHIHVDYREGSTIYIWHGTKPHDRGRDGVAYSVVVGSCNNVHVTGYSCNGANEDYRTIKYSPF